MYRKGLGSSNLSGLDENPDYTLSGLSGVACIQLKCVNLNWSQLFSQQYNNKVPHHVVILNGLSFLHGYHPLYHSD